MESYYNTKGWLYDELDTLLCIQKVYGITIEIIYNRYGTEIPIKGLKSYILEIVHNLEDRYLVNDFITVLDDILSCINVFKTNQDLIDELDGYWHDTISSQIKIIESKIKLAEEEK